MTARTWRQGTPRKLVQLQDLRLDVPVFVFCLVGLVGLLVAWLLGSLPGWLMLVVLFALFACLATCLVFFKRQVDTKRPI